MIRRGAYRYPFPTEVRATSGVSAIEIHLPLLPPSANRLWRRSGRRIHKAPAYTKWLSDMGLIARQQKPGPIKGPYKLSLAVARPDRRRRDIDNLIKPISDLLVSLSVVSDDSLCEMITARWVTTGEGLSVRVERAGIG